MTGRPLRANFAFLAAAPLVLPPAAESAARLQHPTERVEHVLEIEEHIHIELLNFAGSVDVHGTDPGESRTLRVVAIKRLDPGYPAAHAGRLFERTNVNLRRLGRSIAIGPSPLHRLRAGEGEVKRGEAGERGPRDELPITEIRPPRRIPPVSVDFEVWLPDETSLVVRTFSAPITVSGVVARSGSFRFRSISGMIRVRGMKAESLRANTVSGAISLEDAAVRRGTVGTVNSPIRLAGDLAGDGRYELQTHSGEVTLSLGAPPGFSLDARSYLGAVEVIPEIAGDVEERMVEGRHGAGGPDISVNTFSGRIHVSAEESPETDGR